jgi:hypothetical protein
VLFSRIQAIFFDFDITMLKPTYFGILILLLNFCTTNAKLTGLRHVVSQPSRELNSGDDDNIGDYVSPVASPAYESCLNLEVKVDKDVEINYEELKYMNY